jgi:DNA repair exonuclease SbcCD ATPase subunit
MELALAVLLAVTLVALASTWSTLRTERARARRIETRLADARPDPALPEAPPAPPRSVPGEPGGGDPPAPRPEEDSSRLLASAASIRLDRLAAALEPPAARLAAAIEASEPALAAAAERLRTPMPPSAPAPDVSEAIAPELGAESIERALATAEQVSDERTRLADEVRSLRSALDRVASLDGGLSRGLSELSRSADALLPFASSLAGLADRANLLGLNVSLLVARAGDAGAPFEEAATELRGLFEESRRLSRELSEAARRTNDGVRKVATFVEESAGTAASGQERGALASERLGTLDGLCQQLERALTESIRSHRATSDEGTALARRLETARTSLEARTAEAARLRADAEAARSALRATAERIEALRLDGSALRAAALRVTSAA